MDGQTDTTTAYTALAYRLVVKMGHMTLTMLPLKLVVLRLVLAMITCVPVLKSPSACVLKIGLATPNVQNGVAVAVLLIVTIQ